MRKYSLLVGISIVSGSVLHRKRSEAGSRSRTELLVRPPGLRPIWELQPKWRFRILGVQPEQNCGSGCRLRWIRGRERARRSEQRYFHLPVRLSLQLEEITGCSICPVPIWRLGYRIEFITRFTDAGRFCHCGGRWNGHRGDEAHRCEADSTGIHHSQAEQHQLPDNPRYSACVVFRFGEK